MCPQSPDHLLFLSLGYSRGCKAPDARALAMTQRDWPWGVPLGAAFQIWNNRRAAQLNTHTWGSSTLLSPTHATQSQSCNTFGSPCVFSFFRWGLSCLRAAVGSGKGCG